jgi:predicted dehydrogenase
MTENSSTTDSISRREFLTATSASLLLAGCARIQGGPAGAARPAHSGKTRYAHVGVGSRSSFYRGALNKSYAEHGEYVGFCDVNLGRLRMAQADCKTVTGRDVPIYDAADFGKMIAETRPDIVIVTTVDGYHHDYIIRAMEMGCDVITEKPMTTDAEKCRAILDAQRRTGRHCRVTFNYRYSPPRTQVKDLLMKGTIGDVLSVDFHWMLNTSHGADYFRRWHSTKALSGGLMVHKATHHFDLVNWWLSGVPTLVYANGKREFYTPAMARRFGLSGPHERCLTCAEKEKCGFHLDLAKGSLKALYLDNEQYDGYFRDRCVFRPSIDIEDTMNVIVKYDTGATMSYSLNAFNAWEGYHVVFNGTKGRLENRMAEKVYINDGSGEDQGAADAAKSFTRVYPLRDPAYDVEMWSGEGGHGGGDAVLLEDIFSPGTADDPYLRAADHRGGAWSILTGIAANRSMVTGNPVRVADLVPGLAPPDYPAMPTHDAPLPMPGKRRLQEEA